MVNLATGVNDFSLKVEQGSNFNVIEAENCGIFVKEAFELHDQFSKHNLGKNFPWEIPNIISGSKMLWGKAPVLLATGEIIYNAYDWLTSKIAGKQQVEDPFGSPFGYVYQDKSTGRIYVVFRGTLNHSEWYNDVYGELVPWDRSGKVHRGFLDIYNSLKNDLIKILRGFLKSTPQCQEIYFIGHSLGGALSTLAILDVTHELILPMNPQQRPKMVQYTLGSPKVGNQEFADGFKLTDVSLKCYQIVNTFDYVPQLPIEGIFLNPTGLLKVVTGNLNLIVDLLASLPSSNFYVNHGELIKFSVDRGSLESNHDLNRIYCEALARAKKAGELTAN